MASSSSWKLKALIKKNLLILKRNICSTIFEIFFPIFLILLCYIIRQAFQLKTYYFEEEEGEMDFFIQNRSVLYESGNNGAMNQISPKPKFGLSLVPTLKLCSSNNSNHEERPLIATVNVPEKIIQRIKNDSGIYSSLIKFQPFETIDSLEDYIKDTKYGQDNEHKLICFGISFQNEGNKYDYTLHYFDSLFREGIQDLPNVAYGIYDHFSSGPDMDSYDKYRQSGYAYMMTIINEYILQQNSDYKDTKINLGIVPMPYSSRREDPFAAVIGYFIPFFIVIAYMCPLCLYVYRMVGEKENKSKEGMKIMGLSEGTYFLSYFLQYIVIAIVDSILNAVFMHLLFSKIPFILLFIVLLLWTLDVFALAFFFQSFIDKTRVALILSLLIYFVMFFLSMACMDESANKILKIVLSFFPPVCIELGIVLFGKFEGHYRVFHARDYTKTYTNYSILTMNIMQVVDFLLYLFLGYYLQNVLPHDFGIKKPLYFIFTKEYWCGNDKKNKNKKIRNDINQIENNMKIENEDDSQRKLKSKENNKNFEGEELYKDRTNPDDALRIKDIVKIFDDGKMAVAGVNLNFYKDEIFALLGHNGAGKTTLISMLTGLYEATYGEAFYDDYNILDSNNMDKFRTILGICPQHDVLFDDLTIREHLEMFCIFKGYQSGDVDSEINKTLHDFELDDIQNITAKNLSAGQRRKLSIAISLIGGSKVIFLDEPSSGMDITSRRNLWDILKRQTEDKIIILTTHYMEEASVLGKRIGIISAGKMKCIGTPLFLIQRYGKFLSLNISMEEDADVQSIIDFIEKAIPNTDFEILSEEILFRIPKNFFSGEENDVKSEDTLIMDEKQNNTKRRKSTSAESSKKLTEFFENLDNNLKQLKIKSYSASMPTLEDVFLNVASEVEEKQEEDNKNLISEKKGKKHRKFSLVNVENDKILFETDFKEDFTKKSKFCNDFNACFWRRFLLTSRDLKGFLMEILCPILLVLVGLLVSKVDLVKTSKPQIMDMSIIGKQTIMFAGASGINLENYFFEDMSNITCSKLPNFSVDTSNKTKTIKNFVEKMYDLVKDKEDSKDKEVDMMSKSYSGYYGSLLLFNDGADKKKIDIIEVLNTRPSNVVPIYTYYFLKQLVEKKTGALISFKHYPFPLTAELKEQSDQTSNSLIIFFVAIAFSLIPANFVTIIVRENINNSKHLMRVSGISITAYWIVNYIFELFKYYFTCGICIILLYAFDFYRNYLYILYIIYGPAMISCTYILSFLFDNESGAQNGIILLNFLIGALGSTVVLLLRALENVKNIAKVIQYIISFLPSFCFNFGYSMILNKIMIYVIEYPDEWFYFGDSELIKRFNLVLSLIIYLSAEIVVYTFILFLIEFFSYNSKNVSDSKLSTEIEDSKVLKEIERANEELGSIEIFDEKKEPKSIPNAVRIKNLQKKYSTGLCSTTTAIKNMNFCVEPGECFGLLGLNGAGKTTTFKCITQEISPSHGKIYINGKDMRNNFSELSSIFGYCPQFDSIFEYMTVFENLQFYGQIKGIKKEYLDQVVNSMINEMSLSEFTNKMAGKLSGGNKRKLSVAISFLSNPPIVLLDEPSTGMDPEARRFMWSVIHKISKKGKKASVIMTTHSMDEAETLCKRMAIMVKGEFVCLGKAGEIKEKYGYGYELEVRIKPLSEKKFLKIIEKYSIDKNLKINLDNINDILKQLDCENYIDELKKGRFGSKLIRDIHIRKEIPVRTLISWTFFVKNALLFIKDATNYFETIILTEHIDNNFLFKMKKNEKTKSIGFLFGLFENNKEECHVTEYSIQQTSLEQIFNMFEDRQRKLNSNENNEKEEIEINDDVFNSLLKK